MASPSFAKVLLACSVLLAAALPAAADSILIEFEAGAAPSEVTPPLAAAGIVELLPLSTGSTTHLSAWRKAVLAPEVNPETAIASLRQLPGVARATRNNSGEPFLVPDDPLFSEQWGLQDLTPPDADVDAPQAWDLTTGSSDVVVAVVDSGVNYTHPDLAPNMWTNAAEANGSPGVDDDGNGFVDDIHGYDFAECCSSNPSICGIDPDLDLPDGDPSETYPPLFSNGHGSPVAGIIGAATNNALGIAGVAWNVRLMAVKGYEFCVFECAQLAAAVDYAVAMGADIINTSWGIYGECAPLEEAVAAARAAGVFIVVAAGNNASDIDSWQLVPQTLDEPNVVTVAAVTPSGALLSNTSNWGATTVDLGAPYATTSTGPSGAGFTTLYPATSFTAPYVAGTLALLKARAPTLDYLDLKGALLGGTTPEATLSGTTTSGGRLNARTSLAVLDSYGGNSSRYLVCDDGVDNDGDGLTDWPADPQCSRQVGWGLSEAPPPPCGLLGIEVVPLLGLLAWRRGRRAR